ncbi:MAG: hypothetical protein NTY64_12590 [Deltaproteobacteria bacterium]|nr:hypothetical protein [Deltaproteobacteria bacterium]
MAITKEQLIHDVAEKVGPGVALEAKLEKGIWRMTLTKNEKSTALEFKRAFIEDYFEKGEYQQEMAFENRINKALRDLT